MYFPPGFEGYFNLFHASTFFILPENHWLSDGFRGIERYQWYNGIMGKFLYKHLFPFKNADRDHSQGKQVLKFVEIRIFLPSITSAIFFVKKSLHKKCPYSELFWSVFSRIRTEYECGKLRTKKTPNLDTFHTVNLPSNQKQVATRQIQMMEQYVTEAASQWCFMKKPLGT